MTGTATNMENTPPPADLGHDRASSSGEAPPSMETLRTLAQRHFARRIERSAARRVEAGGPTRG